MKWKKEFEVKAKGMLFVLLMVLVLIYFIVNWIDGSESVLLEKTLQDAKLIDLFAVYVIAKFITD